MPRLFGSKDKVRRMYMHSFARQFLKDHGIRIYRGNQQILSPIEHLYDIKLPNTRYYIGERFIKRGPTRKISSYEELNELGFCIISAKVGEERWAKNQSIKYVLKKLTGVRSSDQTGHMPSGKYPVYAELDTYNKKIRLVGSRCGPLGYTDWINTDLPKKTTTNLVKKTRSYRSYGKYGDKIVDNLMNKWLGVEDVLPPIPIPEAAFMITDSNEIVCIPAKPKDMPSILIVGQKRTGKSFLLHSLVDRFFWKPYYDFRIAVLNDSSKEADTWCIPNKENEQILNLKRLNEKPLPLPTVFLHPLVKDADELLFDKEGLGFYITIPFKEIIKNHKAYLKIGDSMRYFTQFKYQLQNCATQEEAEGLLDTISIAFNVPPNTANKIRAEFDTLFDSKMTDISSKKQELWKTSKNLEKYYNPLTACIDAGVLPVLETSNVATDRTMLSYYFRYFVEDLFQRQKLDADFVEEDSKILLVVDEAHNISMKGLETGADMLLRRCVREGGPRRVGTLLCTQKFSELPDIIKDNTTYLISFKNPGDAPKIASEYKLGKHIAKEIINLGKHECIAYTTEHFIVYDSYGNKRKSKLNEVFKGKSLPPYSWHKRPSTED